VKVRTSRISIERRYSKNVRVFLLTRQDARNRTGKIKSVSNKSNIDNPSTPKVRERLNSSRRLIWVKNWNPRSDLSKARQDNTPINRATRELVRIRTRWPCPVGAGVNFVTTNASKSTAVIAITGYCSRKVNILSPASSVNSKEKE
jgi:hypothetical protein